MKISSIKKLKNNMYEVTLENEDKLELYEDIILKYDILLSKRINEDILDEILNDNKVIEAYYLAIKYLKTKMRTKYEIREKLKTFEINDNIIERVIERLQEQRYVDDKYYVEIYINDCLKLNLYGPNKIKKILIEKGVDMDIISEFLDKINDKVWIKRIEKLIEKRKKSNKDGLYVFKNKTINFLLNNGYSLELSNNCIKDIRLDTDYEFKKTAQNEWSKLSKKYKGNTLIFKFKNSMYSKGFTIEQINDYLN